MITLLINKISNSLRTSASFKNALKLYQAGEFPLIFKGTQQGFDSLLIGEFFQHTRSTGLVVLPTEQEAENLYKDLALFSREQAILFPSWGCLPYTDMLPCADVFADRIYTLSRLLNKEPLLIVTSLRACLTPLPDPAYLAGLRLEIRKGDKIELGALIEKLTGYGYLRVPRVSVKGEFAVRGEVLDIFLPGMEQATRLVLGFDEVEDIRLFDTEVQLSKEKVSSVTFYPLREVVFDTERLATLRENLMRSRKQEEGVDELIARLAEETERPGTELYYPLCFNRPFSLLDYLSEDALLYLVSEERLAGNARVLRKEYLELYKRAFSVTGQPGSPRAGTQTRLLPRPKEILLDYETVKTGFKRAVLLTSLSRQAHDDKRVCDFKSEPPRSFFGNFDYLKEELKSLLGWGYAVYIFAVYEHQAARIEAILKDQAVTVLPYSISKGFVLPELKIIVIQENEIFGRKRRIPQSIKQAKSQAIDSFVDLNPGDYVVHINHGIGLYKGIERMRVAGQERDYIHLEYAEKETIFVPIEQANLIQKYIAYDNKRVKLDKIGGKSWSSRKEKVRRSAEELAGRLVKLYSQRLSSNGYRFPPDTDWQSEFEAGFPYQETEDQLKCIEDVKHDMEQSYPMDRLICGDVGYGKTEIALRAAFKAVMAGKQVAMLAPTTILVEQHYENFLERFKRFPVTIAMLSRFRSKQEQKKTLKDLSEGKVDIVIGTHRLVQKDVNFKNLGLMITDEEQRFGVKDKERLKELKTSVDCLTLSATPIPRTLHLSLMKIRDMSVLNTPPHNRQPIKTYILEFNPQIVAEAIHQEIARGGQVYYLHNRVETMPEVHSFLTQLVPDVSIEVAHGQMHNEELEDIMHRFIHNEFKLLLSTTIIENGLDIPNVNTIIIDRADRFGVSQLYQLKGRVGRSETQAYAYLFYPYNSALSELALKRLKIISDFTELGSGFKIALKDLEIRGAGNILGREQSGDILAVGYDMYVRLLEEAIAELKEKQEDQPPEVYLELEYSAYIPDSYIAEPLEKMDVYKKVAAITTEEEHDRVYNELEDRFGPLPDEVLSILSISEIRIICKKLYISSLKEKSGVITVEFARLALISIDKVMRLLRESGGRASLDSKQPNCLLLKTGHIGLKEKSEFIRDQLSRLL